jgi:hypothetical protein
MLEIFNKDNGTLNSKPRLILELYSWSTEEFVVTRPERINFGVRASRESVESLLQEYKGQVKVIADDLYEEEYFLDSLMKSHRFTCTSKKSQMARKPYVDARNEYIYTKV